MDGRTEGNTYKVAVMRINQEAGIGTPLFMHQFRVGTGRVVLNKLR